MAKRLLGLAALLGLVPATAGFSVAFAQQGQYESPGQYDGEEVVVTGMIEDFGTAVEGASQHSVHDGATGGAPPIVGLAGALMLAGGLMARRVFR